MRGLAAAAAALLLAAGHAAAQGTIAAAPKEVAPIAVAGDAQPRAWAYSASLFGYFVPEDQNFAQPTLTADRSRWHVEARYNYEALETGSAWLGYAFSAGKRLKLDITPMLGGVFGDVRGFAPGCELTLGWSRLELYSEGEYFFDVENESEDFFYNWSELVITPASAWRAGFVVQRTRAFQTSVDLQTGLLAGVSYGQVDFTAYVFNLGGEDQTFVISAEVGF